MADDYSLSTIDPNTGYDAATKTYHSLRTPITLPPVTTPLSISDYVLSLLHVSPLFSPSSPLLIDATSSSSLSYSSFLSHVASLSSSLPPIPSRHVALILSPPSFHVPVLYFSLLSLNVVVSPANPLSTPSELSHLVSLSNPSVIFTVSSLLPNFPSYAVSSLPVILLDSPDFLSMLTRPSRLTPDSPESHSTMTRPSRLTPDSPESHSMPTRPSSRLNPDSSDSYSTLTRPSQTEFDSTTTRPSRLGADPAEFDSTTTRPSSRLNPDSSDSYSALTRPSQTEFDSMTTRPSRLGAEPAEFDSVKARTSGLGASRRVVNQDDRAVILYSSGTTGRVKGVELTHRNLIALIGGYYHKHQEDDESTRLTRQVSLVPLPMFHVFGFTMLLRAVSLSETLVMMERFDFEKMLSAVEKYKVAYMPVSPPLIVAMAKSELVKKYDVSSLKLLGCGGAPLGKEVAERFKARFPDVEIVQGYGLTESGGGVSTTVGPEECEKYGSVGRLQELMLAKIVDPSTGEGLPPGKQGELWLRGPTIMKGYVGNKEATTETLLPDGWLKTGDLCYFDNDGCLYIVDRLKELIKYKGYQVPPAELEHLLLSHPEIADAAVVPYPDEEAGEIPMAFVVRKPGSHISESQVMDYVAKQVTPYKRIRRVSFVNAIPKNPSGKILRRELVNQATGGKSKL